MKRKKWLSGLLAGCLCLTLCMPMTAQADGQKVVTLGADLTQDQKNAVLKYFGVYGQNIQTLTITNQDERAHLGSYVPLEQIGTRTFSCALVCPTNSGGIQVKTANLSWVTSNMIASTLSTSGVVNCDVLAASPFEVSGTGALTGIIMAYESASGTTLDPVKKDLATQELITTGQIANEIGQKQATNIVNEIKIQVIEGAVVEPDEVEEIVDEVVDENPEVTLSDEDRALLTGLMTQIAEQQYDYEEMKDTLKRVEENVNNLTENQNSTEPSTDAANISVEPDDTQETEPETLASDSILMNTDDSALGSDVNFDATNEEAVSQDTQPAEETATDEGIFDITTSDTYSDPGADESGDDFWNSDGAGEGTADPGAGESWDDFWNSDDAGDGSPDGSDAGAFFPEEEGTVTDGTGMDDGMTDVPEETAEVMDAPAEIPALELTECHKSPDSSDGTMEYAGISQIRLIYGNSNLVPVNGVLNLKDGWGNLCASVDLTDKDQVRISPLSENDKMTYGWSEGTQIIVNLGFCMAPSQNFTVSVDGVLAQTADASVLDGVPTASVSMNWNVNTDTFGAGVSVDEVSDLYAGASVSGDVMMNETMVYAVISSYDSEKLSFDTIEFTPDAAGFTMNCLQSGTASFTLDYYDGEGNYAGSSTTEVVIP